MDHTSLQRGYTYSLEADWLNGRASASYHALGHPRRNQDSGRLWVRVPCWLIHSDRVISNFGVRFPGYATYSFAFLLLLMFDGLRFLEGGQLCVGTWNFSRNWLGHGTKSIALATFNVEYFTAVEMQVDYTDGMELSLLMGSLVN
jgi:hypothetical protein